jgi:mRNA interferase RelE/StbE
LERARNLSYKIEFLEEAKKDLKKIDCVMQKVIKEKIVLLSENPEKLKNNIKPLKGEFSNKFRLRIRDYRVVFQIENQTVTILIIAIGHRKDIYR